jgi:hypothetical protein
MSEQRPVCVKDESELQEYLDYLDDLRESGVTNMFGAGAYLEDAFNLGRDAARSVLTYWMKTFSDRHPQTVGGAA